MHAEPTTSSTSRRPTTALRCAAAGVLLAASAMPAIAQQRSSAPACTMTAEPMTRLRLSDGATVSIDAMGAARNGPELAVVGRTIAWLLPSQIGPGTKPVLFGLGVIRDARGAFRFVPFPSGMPSEPANPRVVAAGRDGWDFLFTTGTQGTTGNPLAHDTATVWHGRFDGRAWHDVQRVTTVTTATLLVSFASGLVRTRDGLAFAFMFDRSVALRHNRRGTQGLVLARLRGRRWTTDTLLTWEAPRAVDLVARGDTVLAVFTQSVFENERPQRDALYAARHVARWSEPARWLDATPDDVMSPLLAGTDGGPLAVTYRVVAPGADVQRLAWGAEPRNGAPFQPRGVIATLASVDKPAFFRDDAGRPFWVLRDGGAADRVRVVTAGDTLIDLGTLAMPFHNSRVVGAPLPDGRLLAITLALNAQPGEPQAYSAATAFAVTCSSPPPARR